MAKRDRVRVITKTGDEFMLTARRDGGNITAEFGRDAEVIDSPAILDLAERRNDAARTTLRRIVVPQDQIVAVIFDREGDPDADLGNKVSK